MSHSPYGMGNSYENAPEKLSKRERARRVAAQIGMAVEAKTSTAQQEQHKNMVPVLSSKSFVLKNPNAADEDVLLSSKLDEARRAYRQRMMGRNS